VLFSYHIEPNRLLNGRQGAIFINWEIWFANVLFLKEKIYT
jgi:hypothetical protein